MTGGKRYLIDSNVFIEAHKLYYPFTTCPGFWQALLHLHSEKRVFSIDKVKTELLAGKDELTDWVKKAPDTFFKGTADRAVVEEYARMVNWVQNEAQFTLEAKAEFASVADGWLIAYSKANGLVVVTREQFEPSAKKDVKIPNVCVEFKVGFCSPFEMLKDLKVRFVLSRRKPK